MFLPYANWLALRQFGEWRHYRPLVWTALARRDTGALLLVQYVDPHVGAVDWVFAEARQAQHERKAV